LFSYVILVGLFWYFSMNKKLSENQIVVNRKARHEYFIETTYEAGIALQGWEVKSLRAGRVQITEGHVIIKNGEAFLLGSLITPLSTASTHIIADSSRTRKLLLHRAELEKIRGLIDRQGYTLVPLKLYFKKSHIKCLVGLARGKKQHDKRHAEKNKDWQREQARLLKRD
jgi:SsrA-binding protein